MAHTFIVGQTQSGKTNLALTLALQARQHRRVMVLTTTGLMHQTWPADHKTANGEEFARLADMNENLALFIDECGQTVGQHPPPHIEALATVSANRGHRVFFICQRGVQVNPTMRDQSTGLYLFNVSPRDAEAWAEIYNDDALLKAPGLPQYHYIFKQRYKPAQFCAPVRKMK